MHSLLSERTKWQLHYFLPCLPTSQEFFHLQRELCIHKSCCFCSPCSKICRRGGFLCGMPKQCGNAASLCLVHEMLALYMQPASVSHRHDEPTVDIVSSVTNTNCKPRCSVMNFNLNLKLFIILCKRFWRLYIDL